MAGPVLVGLALDARDDAVIALGALLARMSGRPLALGHAYPYEPLTVPTPEYETALRGDALVKLEDHARGLRTDLEVTVHADARLSAAYGLHEMAERLGAAAIVVGSSHHGPTGQVLLGTVATRLLHGSPCPVAVAPAGYHEPAAASLRIGVAYDGTAESEAALEIAIALARRDRASVSVYTVEEPLVVASPIADAGWAGLSEHVAALHSAAEARLERARERLPVDVRASCELLTGRPEDVLTGVSDTLDLLVCGSRGYGPLRAVLLGGVSSALARRASCPLLVVPRGHGGPLADAAPAAPAATADPDRKAGAPS
jgi:nucleotide-binding universal stress UspA family protein